MITVGDDKLQTIQKKKHSLRTPRIQIRPQIRTSIDFLPESTEELFQRKFFFKRRRKQKENIIIKFKSGKVKANSKTSQTERKKYMQIVLALSQEYIRQKTYGEENN